MKLTLRTVASFALASLGLLAPAWSQAEAPPSVTLSYRHDTGSVANTGTRDDVVISFPVHVDGAAWLRLEFEDVQLAGSLFSGTESLLRMTSTYDAAVQEMNSVHVRQWQRTSAYFNGDTVLVEVVAQPGTGANRIVMKSVTAGIGPLPESQCGPTDDRVLSSDARAARLLPIGCTGWLISDCSGCYLTAGHCSGSLQVVEFKVPLSTATGALNHPSPDDQYAVDAASVQSNGGQGVGNDYAYFGTFPNTNTGLTARQAQGASFVLGDPPYNASEQIRITGYGTDNTPSTHNQVQQTHVGPWVTFSGTTVQYQTDTEGGNSGSPVIHEPTGLAVGIHTHGGCTTAGTGQNSGTRQIIAGLQTFLANPQGVCQGGSISVVSAPTSAQPGVPTTVDVSIVGAIVPGSALLHFRVNGGSFTQQALVSQGGGIWRGTLPAGNCGDIIDFWFSVDSATCGMLTAPGNAPASFYTLDVVNELFGDNFETNKGWTATFLNATAGFWERGVPVNDPSWAYDPAADSDGSGQCFLTQNQVGNTDVDGGSVTLTSPALDMSGGSIEIRYDYYLTLTGTGTADRLLVEISSNGTSGPWTQIALHTTNGANAWRSHVIGQAALNAAGVVLTSNMRMRFTANDADPQSIVESGLDAFRVVSTSCCGVAGTFCTAKATTLCGPASIGAAGAPSATATNGFTVSATPAVGNRLGFLLYNTSSMPGVPFAQTGTLCVQASGLRRAGIVGSGGTNGQCNGSFTIDMNAFAHGTYVPPPGQGTTNPAGFLTVPGTQVFSQMWGRDTPGTGELLSNGLNWVVCP